MLLCTDITFIIQKKKHKLFCKRAGIEPTIGHLKTDYRLGRNFYKGLLGDAINVMLAAAAYNLKRAMKVLFRKFPAEIMSYDIRLLLTGKEITYSGNLYDSSPKQDKEHNHLAEQCTFQRVLQTDMAKAAKGFRA